MQIDWMIVATIAAPIAALFVGAWLDRIIEARSRVVCYFGHVSTFRVRDEQQFDVFTHSIVIRNGGRKTATNLRIGHQHFPGNYQIFPPREHELLDVPDAAQEILIPSLVPGEQITISYLYYPPVTWNQINTHVKSDDGFAKILTVIPTKQFPKWFNYSCLFLMVIGAISILYLIATWLIALIPRVEQAQALNI